MIGKINYTCSQQDCLNNFEGECVQRGVECNYGLKDGDNRCTFCKEGRRLPMTDDETKAVMCLLSNRYGHGCYLDFDNSSCEYASGTIKINYCPICGRKLGE